MSKEKTDRKGLGGFFGSYEDSIALLKEKLEDGTLEEFEKIGLCIAISSLQKRLIQELETFEEAKGQELTGIYYDDRRY